MAKILVADDNSNIQKMVGLALKDQGIDVVAVGNGEAAVRKISDVRPDLVLADVFMPVRNGYEVCKYVKDDSALSHIPVILLVGAFDPLDEQEAQRVGADGVLKKPFVPPDPLISMVKSALTRAGVAVDGAADAKADAAPPLSGADLLAPRSPAPLSTAAPSPPFTTEEQPEEATTRPPALKIEGGAPVAFGSLLESPATEEDDTAFIAPAPPVFGEERTWGAGAEKDDEEQEEEEESANSSWRRDGGDEELKAADDIPSAVRDWRDAALGQSTSGKSTGEGWGTPAPEPVAVEAAASEPAVQSREVGTATEISSSRTEPGGPAAVVPWPAAPQTALTVETEIRAQFAQREPAETHPLAREENREPVETSPYSSEPLATDSHAARAREPEAVAVKQPEPDRGAQGSWFSTAPSPWDAEVKKASQLASTWDVPSDSKAPDAQPDLANPEAKAESTSDPDATQTVIAQAEEAGLPESAVETIREEVAEVAETANAATSTAKSHSAAELQMEDLVAKVLAKMSPEVLQAVTREILKPVVEAIVRDELKK